MKYMNSKFFVTCLAMPIIVAGCQDESHDDSAKEKTIKVKTLQVSSRTLAAEKRYSGTVEESSGSSLSFSVPGTVSKVYVKTGDREVKGQPIASIDATTLTSSYHAAKASLDQAQDAYDRLKVLYEEKSLPEIKWVDMQSKLQQAKAMEEVARKNLKDCQLTAPFEGVIAGKKVEIGQNVAPGVPVVDLVSMQQVKIKVSVPEGDIADIQVGDEALVCIPAAENLCLEGRVMEKGIVANPLSRSYEVKIAVENRKHVLLPGMVTDVCVMSNREKSAILLPSHIVQIDEQNQTFVWVNQNGRASKRIITCGEYTSGGVVVESGIGSGDEIIISGQHKVCEGSAVSL